MGKVCVVVSVTLLVLMGCGGSDDSASSNANTPAATPATTPVPAMNTTNAATDTGATAGMGAADPAAMPMSVNLGAVVEMFTPMCDPDVQSVTECGGVACPAVNNIAALGCVVNCCAEGVCGTQVAALTVLPATECAATAQPDPDCPTSMLGPITLQGCCLEDTNTCGLISFGACNPSMNAMTTMGAMMPAMMSGDMMSGDMAMAEEPAMADAGMPMDTMEPADMMQDMMQADMMAAASMGPVSCDGTPIETTPAPAPAPTPDPMPTPDP